MEVTETFVVSVNSSWQIIYKCAFANVNDKEMAIYFITSNGGFGQRGMYIEQITKKQALDLIEKMKESVPTDI